MGSSGSKRKGRKHLPKVGTPADRTWEQHEARRDVVGNFGVHPERGEGSRIAYWVIAALIALAAVGAILALVAIA